MEDWPRKRRCRLPFSAPQALAVAFGLLRVTFLGFAIFNDTPMGGEPMAKVAYDPSTLPGDKTKPKAAMPMAQQKTAATSAPAAATQTITIIDGSSGKRQDVMVGGGEPASEKIDVQAAPEMAGLNPNRL